jgi:hypothetical protein
MNRRELLENPFTVVRSDAAVLLAAERVRGHVVYGRVVHVVMPAWMRNANRSPRSTSRVATFDVTCHHRRRESVRGVVRDLEGLAFTPDLDDRARSDRHRLREDVLASRAGRRVRRGQHWTIDPRGAPSGARRGRAPSYEPRISSRRPARRRDRARPLRSEARRRRGGLASVRDVEAEERGRSRRVVARAAHRYQRTGYARLALRKTLAVRAEHRLLFRADRRNVTTGVAGRARGDSTRSGGSLRQFLDRAGTGALKRTLRDADPSKHPKTERQLMRWAPSSSAWTEIHLPARRGSAPEAKTLLTTHGPRIYVEATVARIPTSTRLVRRRPCTRRRPRSAS